MSDPGPSAVELPESLADTPLGRADPATVGRIAKWALVALAVLGFGAIFVVGARQPKDPTLSTGARIPGFDLAMVHIEPAAGSGAGASDRCVPLAADAAQRSKGLMGRSDLAGYDAMAFRFASDSTVLFYNRDVPIALTVAWFDANGAYLGAKDLDPCPDVEGCPTIASPAPYRYALETLRGKVGDLGVGPGATITVHPGC